ncbi:MAG TPA: alpha/beta fold hydrolase [Hyphomonadaceae bacterium]|jgi:pimeloyl-ACP methyl ester carboxylesterase|nr:alpha/beta fold hydrolase [Hyphomonadaceae bacterium]
MRKFLIAAAAAMLLAGACQSAATPAYLLDPPRDAAHPARMEVLHIPSGGVEINGVAYLASGAGTHPTLVIAHGWPGNEKNLDLAQAVRRAGWNAITFNYRGSWGSPGDFHFSQVLEDPVAVLAWLRQPDVAARLGIDPRRIAIAGHSMGGWAAARTAGNDPALLGAILISSADMGGRATRPRADVVKQAAGNAETLANTSPDKMADELIANTDTFSLLLAAPGLAKLPVLVLTADDGSSVAADKLIAAIHAQGGAKVQLHHEATDHSWSDRRITLEGLIIDWLQTLPAPR